MHSPCEIESAFRRLSRPGARHEALQLLVGRWQIAMATHTGTEPDRVTRSDAIYSDKSWFGGGRYIREEVRGDFAGREHTKTTILGYNNVRERYEYVTADNYDAAVLFYCSLPGQAGSGWPITLFAEYVYAGDGPEPSGSLVTIRTTIDVEGPDRHTLRNYYHSAGKAEYLFLEYVYTRMS